MNDTDFLLWIHELLEKRFGENPKNDYMRKLQGIAESINADVCTPAAPEKIPLQSKYEKKIL